MTDCEAAALLNGMANGVTQVEQLALPFVPLIPADNIAFNAYTARNNRLALFVYRFLQGFKELCIT